MSHLVTIASKVRDPAAIEAACHRLGLPAPVHGKAELFSGEVSGLLLRFPGWQYPAVIDTASGVISYDNWEGAWGNQSEMDRFLQMYSVEKAKLEARRRGYTVNEQLLSEGSIRVQIIEAA